ncbi:MAG: A24 family peptidase [Thermosediminibacteraceae bacterium]|nr:A24 family peptidase [Thermosediminibacteraceae bacterium]
MEAIKVRYVPVIILLGYLSYVDLKKREVPDLAVLALFIYSLLACRNLKEGLITGGLVFIVHLSAAVITNGGIGGGDIKLMSVLAFLLGRDFFLMVLPMAWLMIAMLVYALFTGRGLRYSIPLVPYIFISFVLWRWFLWKA